MSSPCSDRAARYFSSPPSSRRSRSSRAKLIRLHATYSEIGHSTVCTRPQRQSSAKKVHRPAASSGVGCGSPHGVSGGGDAGGQPPSGQYTGALTVMPVPQ